MKKVLLCALALLLAVTSVPAARAETRTTIMIYLTGSEIQEDAVEDVQEMLAAYTGSSVTIAIEAGGSKRWDNYFQGGRINRCAIRNNKMRDMQTLPNQNMGQAQTVVSFMDWAVSSYPADRYVLVFWNHGGGTDSGVCWDETYNDDFLNLSEIREALSGYQKKNPGFRLELVGFDACLMATYEVAATVCEYADYMVASEELEPGWAWDYTGWISDLGRKPNMSGQDIGVSIVDTYMKCSRKNDASEPVSMSVVYLPAVTSLTEKIEAYSDYLSQALEQDQLSFLSRAQRNMYSFGDYYDASSGCVDMMAFLNGTRQIAPSAAAEVETAYKLAVRYSAGNNQFDYLTGLSIFFPDAYHDTRDWNMPDVCPKHVNFIRSFLREKSGGDYIFTASTPYWQDSGDFCSTYYNSPSSFSLPSFGFFPFDSGCYDSDYYDWDSCDSGYYGWDSYDSGSYDSGSCDSGVCSVEPNADIPLNMPPVFSSLTSDIAQTGPIMPQEEEEEAPAFLLEGENPLGGYTVQLGKDEIQYLASAEGQLYMDVSDEETNILVLIATMQDVAINWDTGEVTSLYDGLWPILNDQLVVTYDVVHTRLMRRSLIPVTLNGQEGYLTATRAADDPNWTIIGFSEGYDDSGKPMRGVVKLQKGDVIVPLYEAVYWEDGDDDVETITVEGDPITVDENLELVSLPMEDDGEDLIPYLFAFELEDIFGETQLTDFVKFEM